jgi:hypothetical protein
LAQELIVVGCLMIVFRRKLAAAQVRGQNEAWGLNMGPRSMRTSSLVILLVGLGCVMGGVLALAGALHVT